MKVYQVTNKDCLLFVLAFLALLEFIVIVVQVVIIHRNSDAINASFDVIEKLMNLQ